MVVGAVGFVQQRAWRGICQQWGNFSDVGIVVMPHAHIFICLDREGRLALHDIHGPGIAVRKAVLSMCIPQMKTKSHAFQAIVVYTRKRTCLRREQVRMTMSLTNLASCPTEEGQSAVTTF